MEWVLPVNKILRDDITKIQKSLIPPEFKGSVTDIRIIKECLIKHIDRIGEKSAQAQGLEKPVTSGEKIRSGDNIALYVLKDASGNNGNGEIIGILKIGKKRLFLYDGKNKMHEVEPTCVLDFFVVADRQRSGYGRKLFDFMLNDINLNPKMLAIDGPSNKMEQFLMKNYKMGPLIKQPNNFALAPEFFDNSDLSISNSGRSTPEPTETGRYAAGRPASTVASIIHGGPSNSIPNNYYQHRPGEVGTPAAESVPLPGEVEELVHEVEAEASGPEYPAEEEDSLSVEVHTSPERPTTLPVCGTDLAPPEPSPAGSTSSRRDSQLTEKGFFDVKFYHNKLW